eukprot:767809-Hanusia_phi.AAC.1
MKQASSQPKAKLKKVHSVNFHHAIEKSMLTESHDDAEVNLATKSPDVEDEDEDEDIDQAKSPMSRLQEHASFDVLRDFVRATGGGAGSFFGKHKCFALGVKRKGKETLSAKETVKFKYQIPSGFCEGRMPKYAKDAQHVDGFYSFVSPSEDADVAFGCISWDASKDPACYVRIPELVSRTSVEDGRGQDDAQLALLVVFFMERVWHLRTPKLLVSLIGSSLDFDMNIESRNAFFKHLVAVAKNTRAWITTIGIDAGVAKMVGEAKRASEADIPLIGICPWGLVEGRQALWDYPADCRVLAHVEKMPVNNFGEHEKKFAALRPRALSSARLNRDHSHFLLYDDDSVGEFGGETKLRMAVEACIQQSDRNAFCKLGKELAARGLGWQQATLFSDESSHTEQVDTVCVCVQGGAGTVRKLVESIRARTPVLLIKGSGKIADLLADALQYRKHTHRPTQGLQRNSLQSEDEFGRA